MRTALLCLLALTLVARADWNWQEDGGWVQFGRSLEGDGGANDLLRGSKRALARQRYDDALRGLETYLREFPGSLKEAEAAYLRGEVLYQQGRLVEAHEALSQVTYRYPRFADIRLVIEREYDIAAALLNGTPTGTFMGFETSSEDLGRQILEDLASNYEFEAFSDDAIYLIASYEYRNEEYESALASYQRLLRRHPDSEWAGVCLFQQALCHIAMSDSPRYDQTHLRAAQQLLQKYVDEFEGELTVKGRKVLEGLEEDFAAHDLAIAEWYLWEDQPRAAAIYLESILRLYPESRTAGEAGRKLAELQKEGLVDE